MHDRHCSVYSHHEKIGQSFPNQSFPLRNIPPFFRGSGTGVQINIFQYCICPGIDCPQGSRHTFHLFHVIIRSQHPKSIPFHKVISGLTIPYPQPSPKKIKPGNDIQRIYRLKTLIISLIKIGKSVISFIRTSEKIFTRHKTEKEEEEAKEDDMSIISHFS